MSIFGASAKPDRIFKTEDGQLVYGMMAEYATPADVYHAAEKVRDAGYAKWDLYTPFPIHGIEEAMGQKNTKLPLLCGIVGLSAAGMGYALQHIISMMYPLVVQGKGPSDWPKFVPITFEVGILLTAFTALLGMFALNGLPMWYHPLMKKRRFLRTSDDRFVICIEAADPKFDPAGTRELLASAGGTNIDLVED